jgi:ribosomal protein L11 methyltransferase
VWPRRSRPIADDPRPVRVLELVVGDERVDLISGLLWGSGISAVAEHDLGDDRTLLRCDVPPGGVDAVATTVGDLADVHERVLDDDGLDAWRDHAEVVVAGDHLVVQPPWVRLTTSELPTNAVIVTVDPARAWGHGAHPTTRLCLAEVERACRDRVGMHVLDLGCGSGVLGVAAARLGAAAVLAVDVDPAAVSATTDNAQRNGVDDRVQVVHASSAADPLREVHDSYDLVVANIGAATLTALAPDIVDHLADDAILVVSGLLDPVDDHLLDAFEPWRAARTATLDGWSAVVLRSPSIATPRVVGG